MLAIIQLDDSFDGNCSNCKFFYTSLEHDNPSDRSSPISVCGKCYLLNMDISKYTVDENGKGRPKYLCPILAKISGDLSSLEDII